MQGRHETERQTQDVRAAERAGAQEHGTDDGGQPKGLIKKLTCWICGRDLIFNSVRASAGAVHVQLFCKCCNTQRSIELHLNPGDAYTMFGKTQQDAER